MKTIVIATAALLQIAVLVFMAGSRELIVRTGRTVFFRTAPVDPRDPMRGDYVHLDYEISRVPLSQCTPDLALSLTGSVDGAGYRCKHSAPVCATLHIEDDGIANVVSMSKAPPAEGVYLRGSVDQQYAMYWQHDATVKYGIEAWFVEQGTGTNLEHRRMQNGIQLPLEMEAALSSRGHAVLKGYRWARIGIGLDLVTEDLPPTNRWVRHRPIGATLRLLNAGTDDVALVNLPEGQSWAITSEQGSDKPWRWVGETRLPPAPQPTDVIILAPGQVLTNRFEFSDPRWFVYKDEPPVGTMTPRPLNNESNGWTSFRFEYRAPSREDCAGLPKSPAIWHGCLKSSAFWPSGRVD